MTKASKTSKGRKAPSRRERWRRRGIVAGTTVVILVVVAYVATAVLDVPAPHRLARLMVTSPSQQGTLFATRTVEPAVAPSLLPPADGVALPENVPWKGERIAVEEFLDTTHTRAFVVLHDGRVVEEWYADGVDAQTRLSSWSVAKSVISLLIGRAIADGQLTEDDRLVDLVPSLKGGSGAYDDITVRDLLDMTSGVDVAENYKEYWPFTGTARMFLTTDLPAYLRAHRGLRFAPGSEGEYRSVDTQLLGMILREVSGTSLAELLTERLWQPMGAESAATWNLDHDDGTEKAFCCLNATARDFARIGQLVLDGGVARGTGGEQVVPPAWIERISTPAPHPVDDWGYSAQWWHPEGAKRDFSAIGVYGQYVFVDPATDTVVVKLSDHGTEQDELDTVKVFRSIARRL